MSSIKERPILFSAPMVRAILAGQKTQTRRLVKQKITAGAMARGYVQVVGAGEENILVSGCPYGAPGERLWVREDFRAKSWSADGGWGEIEYQAGGARLINGAPWSFADAYPEKYPVDRWRSARFMPHWAARLWLEVVSVRVERVQQITEEDAIAEGITRRAEGPGFECDGVLAITARDAFEMLWERINGKKASWVSNPWVWVVEFRRVP